MHVKPIISRFLNTFFFARNACPMAASKRAAHLNKLAKAKRRKPRAAGGSGANVDGYEAEHVAAA